MSAKRKVVSIQAERNKRSGRSYVAQLNDKTLANAYNHGQPWDDTDVGKLCQMINKDKTTLDMALELGRSYYAAQYARSHVGFAMRHAKVLRKYI
jgi:hypothetical protein